ncbi:MAG: DivIVA domain-containing protein [Gemmatimonadales bacterium]
MNDEFHLTPVDVRQQEFRRAAFGYERPDVDDFRERVAAEMERLLRERAQMEERVANLREQLKTFRDRERALNEALVAAQQLRAATQDSARKEADLTLREARAEADKIVAQAREAEGLIRRDVEAAQRQFTGYLAATRHLLERHLAEVDALDAQSRDGSPPAL